MKTLILFLFITISAKAQLFTFERESIILKTDTMEVREAFDLLDKVLPWQSRMLDRVVIINNQRYWKRVYLVNRLILGKDKVYTMIEGKKRKIHI